jgi:fatty acid desaturase
MNFPFVSALVECVSSTYKDTSEMTSTSEMPHAGRQGASAGPVEPRESMRVLPRWSQLPLTALTGRPYQGQRPVRLSPTFHLAGAFASMTVGAMISAVSLVVGGVWLLALPVGWAVTLHGMRNLRMMVYHQCAHRNMYGRRRLDLAIGRVCSSLLLVQNFGRYSAEHLGDHHSLEHMTLRDPTVQAFLLSLDLRPGMSRRRMWRRLIGKLLSPRFHLAFALGRLRSFWHGSDIPERLIALGCYGAMVAAAWLTGSWPVLLVGWLFPLFPLFQVSNTLRLCVKHTFPNPAVTERVGKAYFASLTNAIFLGEPVPSGVRGPVRLAGAWARWTTRMLLVHFPARYLVLTGDTVCHDFHHRHPSSRQWPNYVFARQADIEAGHPGWPAYHEAWGLVPAINLVLDSLSVADPDEFDAGKIRSVSKRELFAAFDD